MNAQYFLSIVDLNDTRIPAKSASDEIARQNTRAKALQETAMIFNKSGQKTAPVALALINNSEVKGQADRVSWSEPKLNAI